MKTSYKVGIGPDNQLLDLSLEEIFRILEAEEPAPFTILDPYYLISCMENLSKAERFRLSIDFLLHATSDKEQSCPNLIHYNIFFPIWIIFINTKLISIFIPT